ncbi:MAG: flagellar basal-body MS-ring/collar protein FliF [Christensenellales bacterium]
MADFLKKTGTKIIAFFKKMKKGQRTRFIILVSLMMALILFVVVFLNQKSYTVLYSGMESADAGKVMAVLADMNVDAKTQGSDTILVPAQEADEIRMELASQGYPESGYNFDIFKNASGLGTTDMEKKVYLQFQLQENLRQTIKKLNKVEDAVVNITLADDSAFVLSDNNKKSSAAVMLTLEDGQRVNNDEVRAIAELVSKSISGLQMEDVRIIDSQMKLYSLENESGTGNIGSQMELKQEVQNSLQKQVINLLTPVFGENKILAEVSVTLNFDAQTTESIVFTPPIEGSDGGIIVSMQELAETIKNYDGSTGGSAGTSSNSGTNQYPASSGGGDAVYEKISSETNYEINQTKTLIENAKGRIQDLSVSVILDSSDNPQDYTENVRKLVATAIGVHSDKITVEMLPFKKMEGTDVENAVTVQSDLMSSIQNASTTRIIIVSAAALAGFVLLLFVIKSLRRPAEKDLLLAAEGQGRVEVMADEEINLDTIYSEDSFEAKGNSSLAKLEKYIEKSPESVAQLLRNWLSDEYGR